MKKVVIALLLTCLFNMGFSQTDSSLLYLRFPVIPPFSIVKLPDSSVFTKDNLSKKKATLIMIFSPDCDHCQLETKALTANIKLFKKAQIIMASNRDYPVIKEFYDEYQLSLYPNLIIGRDPSYFFGSFYKVRSFPSIFLYDKKGNFVKAFDGSVPVTVIASYL